MSKISTVAWLFVQQFFRLTSKLFITDSLWGESTDHRLIPSQRANNAVSILRRHYDHETTETYRSYLIFVIMHALNTPFFRVSSTTPPRESDLAPHPDTLLQSWNALMERCTICCKDSLCNRYNLPPGATLYNHANAMTSVNIYLATAIAYIFTAQYLLWQMP